MAIAQTVTDTWADLKALAARRRNAIVASYVVAAVVAVCVAALSWLGVEHRGVRFAGHAEQAAA